MIEEVLKNVREAEAEGALIKERAEKRAEEIRLSADAEAADILSRAKSAAKENNAAAIEKARLYVAEEDEKERAACEKECKMLVEATMATAAELVDEVFSRILNGSC